MKNSTKILVLAISIFMSACAVRQDGTVGVDRDVFGKDKVIPLGAGVLSAVVCRELWKGHGNRDSWTAICGAAGYFGSQAFLKQHNNALEKNRVGQTTSWEDPDGKQHSVTPTQTYYRGDTPCREFRQTVEIDGQTEIMTGNACRQADGSWKLVS
jgi:hypothetical protein